jgi:predicted nuclease of predicted toxin-antitoxin system
LRFLVDAQLPPRLVHRLTELGHDAFHVFDLGLISAADRQVWDEALTRGAILVTKDQDFPALRTKLNEGPLIVWIRMGNIDNQTLIRRFIGAIDEIVAAIERGDSIVELVSR